MNDRQTLLNCIAWNRKMLDGAWKARNSEDKAKALEACRAARRYGDNLAALEARLLAL